MKNLQTLRADVQTEMALDPGSISETERTRFINAGIEDLSLLQLWEREIVIPVTANTTNINMPTEHVATVQVLWGDRVLVPVERTAAPGSVSGNPIGYIEKQGLPNMLELYPRQTVPGNLFVLFRYRGVPLVNFNDVPVFHIDVSELLIDFAVARAHRKNGNILLFNQYMSYYELKKGALHDRLLRDYNSRVRTIAPSNDLMPLTPFDFL